MLHRSTKLYKKVPSVKKIFPVNCLLLLRTIPVVDEARNDRNDETAALKSTDTMLVMRKIIRGSSCEKMGCILPTRLVSPTVVEGSSGWHEACTRFIRNWPKLSSIRTRLFIAINAFSVIVTIAFFLFA